MYKLSNCNNVFLCTFVACNSVQRMSKLDLSKIKEIPQRDKDVIHGYIRNVQDTYFQDIDESFHIIPALLINLCILFCCDITDEFDPKLTGKCIEISNKNKTILHIAKDVGWSTSYGKRIIPSIDNNTYIWKLKTIQNSTISVYIGIDNSNAKWINDRFHTKTDKASYAYNAFTGRLFSWNDGPNTRTKYTHSFEGKDNIMIMKLIFNNNNEGILSYQIGNRPEYIAYRDVVRDKLLDYRLAICMHARFTGVELMQFECYSTDDVDTDK